MPKPPPSVCIVIPAFEEEKRIGAVVRETLEYCPQARVVVVDDGSADHTDQAAEEAGAVVLEHVHNQGKGAALQTGFDHARDNGFELVITLDADGQHAPSDVPAFLQAHARTGNSILVGNRMGQPEAMPALRRFVNRFMSNLLSRRMGQYVPDTQCGFRLYHVSVLPQGPLDETSRRYAAESEILLRLSLRGFKIGSVPIQTIYAGETSKVRPFSDALRFFRMLRRFRKIEKEHLRP